MIANELRFDGTKDNPYPPRTTIWCGNVAAKPKRGWMFE